MKREWTRRLTQHHWRLGALCTSCLSFSFFLFFIPQPTFARHPSAPGRPDTFPFTIKLTAKLVILNTHQNHVRTFSLLPNFFLNCCTRVLLCSSTIQTELTARLACNTNLYFWSHPPPVSPSLFAAPGEASYEWSFLIIIIVKLDHTHRDIM